MSLAHFPRLIFGPAILRGNLEIVPQRRFDPQGDRKRSIREERESNAGCLVRRVRYLNLGLWLVVSRPIPFEHIEDHLIRITSK